MMKSSPDRPAKRRSGRPSPHVAAGRRRSGTFLTLTIGLACVVTSAPAELSAQESARARAQATLPAEVVAELDALAAEMAPAGVPAEPLYTKALEGAAKRVPPDRLLPAVRSYADRLGRARRALGPTAGMPLLVAGADALQRGVPDDALRGLPSDLPRSPVAVLVLAELVESGVPTDRALETLREAMARRTRDARMLDIPARVRRLVRDGVPPREAIDRVRRQLRARGGMVGPALPLGDASLSDRRIRDWRRRLSGG
jgi:hypothetical protein